MPVRVAQLPRPQRRGPFDELVAGRQHTDTRTGHDRDFGDTEAGEHTEMRSSEHDAGIDHDVARADVVADDSDVITASRRHLDADAAAVVERLGLLDDHDGVRPFGDDRAGHDPHGLARADANGGWVAKSFGCRIN